MMRVVRTVSPWVCALSVAAALSACKSAELVPKIPGLSPYRMTIQQGNYLSQEMVAQLKPGMTREQVRFVLGTPLVADIFHADRWDYVYFRETGDGKREQRNLSVVFEKDRLARVVGDLLPPEGTKVQSGGFTPQVNTDAPAKPAASPPKEAAAAPKPAAEDAKPATEAAKPADDWTPTKQNWGAASDEPAPKPEATPVAKDEEQKPAEESKEPGFFSRMLEKIGL